MILKMFKCEICNKEFMSENSTSIHKQVFHSFSKKTEKKVNYHIFLDFNTKNKEVIEIINELIKKDIDIVKYNIEEVK